MPPKKTEKTPQKKNAGGRRSAANGTSASRPSRRTQTIGRVNGSHDLVIVESPAKARTLAGILGANYEITASVGHVRDLPKSKLGVDIENGFAPQYIVPREKR